MYTVEIKNARYLYGFAQLSQYRPLEMPEIAVAGKSNVGKSSFINMLTNINGLAKVGQTPGKTRMINVFLLNGRQLYFDGSSGIRLRQGGKVGAGAFFAFD